MVKKYQFFNTWGPIALAVLTSLVILGNGCSKNDITNRSLPNTPNDQMKSLSAEGNGDAYDGKIVKYISRNQVLCPEGSKPKSLILKNKLTGAIQIESQKLFEDGNCQTILNNEQANVEVFDDSNLAAFEGGLHDRVLEFGDPVLDNQRTKIACKLSLGPLALLDNMWSGAVVMETQSQYQWASRLDFTSRTEKSQFIIDSPPIGKLIQTQNTLEFQSIKDSYVLAPGVFHLMQTRIDRSIELMDNSDLRPKDKIYTGTVQYFFLDTRASSSSSISISPADIRCFVDDIAPERIQIELTNNFDFITELLNYFKSLSSSH